MKFRTIVEHWHYNDGWRDVPNVLRKNGEPSREFDRGLMGWHCWVYPGDDNSFTEWMTKNMKGDHDLTFRFNSGDPMFTVHIKDPQDATLFKLTWL
jgi:hypothetical protein